jgi:uncharacterized protein YbjT (DUF2867 family)
MRVMVVGATGLIGSAVTATLLTDGNEVIGVARRVPQSRNSPGMDWIATDLGVMVRPADWDPYLRNVHAVVYCAGTLQDAPGESTVAVHDDAVAALAEACSRRGIRRFVHLSAIGVDRETPTGFSRSKRTGDARLAATDLDWVILRPSVVTGPQAYGGSALFRGLASLPVLPSLPGTGPLQIVQLADVASTVRFFLQPGAPARVALDLAGPAPLRLEEIVLLYRRWLGWPAPRVVPFPGWAAAALFRAGDLAGMLGWKPPLRSTAEREIVRGAVGDPAPWTTITGIRPQSLEEALKATPAGVQERWFASLYFLKPLAFITLALFWLVTGLLSVGPGYAIGVSLMQEGGAGWLSGPSVIAGGIADIAIGIGIAVRRTARIALWAGLAISVFYAIAGTALVPRLWIDPLGPMVKIWPIMVLMLLALAILRDR